MVPSLSVQSIKELKLAVINAVESCDRPKLEILLKGCFKLICGLAYDLHSAGEGGMGREEGSGRERVREEMGERGRATKREGAVKRERNS